MSKRYCFRIINKQDIKLDKTKLDELLQFITKLYIDNSDEKDKLSFFPYYSKGINDDNVCIQMTGRGKAMIEKIEKINEMLGENPSMLKWLYGISLSDPYEYDDTQEQGFPLKLEKTKGQKRWSSIIQRGPYFKEIMEPYVPLNASLFITKGKRIEYKLTPKEEKVAGFYATRIRADAKDIAKTQYTKLEKFNQNFWKDFQTYLTPKAKSIFKSYDDFLQIDWSDLVDKLEQKTLVEKELAKTKEEKDRKKQKTAQIKSEYGYAILDGKPLQKIGNYQVEISGIFLGKKGHPKLGRIKKQIMPEDVTINIGENDPEPKAPLGHTWAEVVNDYTRVWLASWKDEINNKIKYIWFSPEGVFKAQSDFNKYEKARKLHFQIEEIRTNYMKLAESSNMVQKQIGTVLFLIDRFGIRIGNETESDKADPVVGATTLLVSNINVDKKNIVIFDFEGKDNVRFYKELEVPENIYKNFKELKEEKGKKSHNQLFDQISSENVNDYLKDIDPSFTAKVFRTRLASEIMYNALQELPPIPSKSTKTDIKKEFNKANIKVAEVLNHVRTAASNKSMETLKNSLKEAEKEKNTEKINKLTKQIEEKQILMSVAINTSLVNYIDPRIVASWTKSQNVPIDSVYNTTLQAKFKWAINLINDKDDEWSWEDSPLEEEGEDVEEESKKSRKENITRPPKTTPPTKPSRLPPEPPPTKPSRLPPTKPSRLPPKTTPDPPPTKRSRLPPKTTPEPPPTKPSRLPPKTETTPKIKKSYKMSAPRKITKNYEIDKVKTFKWEQNIVDSPKILESYKLLLELCENLKSGNNHNDELISKISPLVLKWVYPLSKEAINTGNGNYIANKYIIEYCDKEIFNSITSPTPTPPYPKHPLSAPIFSRTLSTPSPTPSESLSERDISSLFGSISTPTPSPPKNPLSAPIFARTLSTQSLTPSESLPERDISSLFGSSSSSSPTPTPTPTPTPPPKKQKNNEDIKIMLDGTIVFITNKKTSGIKKISPEIAQKFTGLNTYTNDKDLKDFCIKNNIDYKGKTKREIKENIIEIYKDKKQRDIPI